MTEKTVENRSENALQEGVKTSPTKCTATRTGGGECGAWEIQGTGLCYRHDPSRREEALAASRRGGVQRRFRASKQKSIKEMQAQFERITGSVIEPGVNGAADYHSLEDLRHAAMIQVERLRGLVLSGEMSPAAGSGALLQWLQFVRLLMIDIGPVTMVDRMAVVEDEMFNRDLARKRSIDKVEGRG